MKKWFCLALTLFLAAPMVWAQESQNGEKKVDADAIRAEVAPALVRVQYTVKWDKGEMPWSGSRFHGDDAREVLQQERPMEAQGYLVGETTVLTHHPYIHPRFLEKIEVRWGDTVVGATYGAYALEQDAVLLTLEKPIDGTRPLTFVEGDPALRVDFAEYNADWTIGIEPFGKAPNYKTDGRKFWWSSDEVLLLNKEGKPVGVTFNAEVHQGGSWNSDPTTWPQISAADMDARMKAFEARAGASLVRANLHFRSPRKTRSAASLYGEEDSVTELNVTGIVVNGNQVLVLVGLPRKTTARLETITLFPQSGEPFKAKFAYTLKDYDAFVATLEAPATVSAELSTQEALSYQYDLLLSADVQINGEQRVDYYGHRRPTVFGTGWMSRIYPSRTGPYWNVFLFDSEERLAFFPLARRKKASEQGSRGGNSAIPMPALYIQEVLANPEGHTDEANVPLSEDDENRLAWLGVELQPLTAELARANNVADLTRDGATGALVTYVYEGSPAAKAGLEMGHILIRMHIEDEPKPLEIQIEDPNVFAGGFPWDQLDDLPEEYYDRIPTPWPTRETNLTKALTTAGMGKKYTLEYADDTGTVSKAELTIEESPTHYESAARFKHEDTGITVRNLTYENRRYFMIPEGQPGVIVADLEKGSKASISGVKPFELIIQVDGVDIKTPADFEKALSGKAEVELFIKRMTRGRLVKLELEGAVETPDDGDSDEATDKDTDDDLGEGVREPQSEDPLDDIDD
jgi:hypothetical protein